VIVTILVTGCAGFIGSHLVDRLLAEGESVIGVDNFSTGMRPFLNHAMCHRQFTLIEDDLINLEKLMNHFSHGVDCVFHLAANADVRFGTHHPNKDLQQNTICTFNVLEAMRANQIKKIVFSSTGSIYGESVVLPTPENAPFPIQTSLYGASKLAAEGLIQAYCEGFDFQAYIFRFVSILGERYSHGHVFDFYKQLKKDPNNLKVLGDGKQKKSYLDVQDCMDAVLYALKHTDEKVNIFNLGTNEYCQVNDSIRWICQELGFSPKRYYTGDKRGWIGDNPFIFLDCTKMRALGWQPKLSIKEGIIKTIRFINANPWIVEERTCG
jgi:UDP-glucose 4-epimerase